MIHNFGYFRVIVLYWVKDEFLRLFLTRTRYNGIFFTSDRGSCMLVGTWFLVILGRLGVEICNSETRFHLFTPK